MTEEEKASFVDTDEAENDIVCYRSSILLMWSHRKLTVYVICYLIFT